MYSPDTCVFLATLYKGFDLYRNMVGGTAAILVRIMMRDGRHNYLSYLLDAD